MRLELGTVIFSLQSIVLGSVNDVSVFTVTASSRELRIRLSVLSAPFFVSARDELVLPPEIPAISLPDFAAS